MNTLRVVSADSHTTEPPELWLQRLDVSLRERGPRVVYDQKAVSHLLVADGIPPVRVSGVFAAGRSGEALREFLSKGYEAARPSGWDPAERLKDQDLDGISAEVLYPSLCMPLFALPDPVLQRACFAVYNDWVAEFCAYCPERLYGVGLISLDDIDAGVKELERICSKNLRGAMISVAPLDEDPYSSSRYDKFWQAASALQVPVSLHAVTSSGRGAKVNWAQVSAWYVLLVHEIQRTLTDIVFGGVLERLPELKIVSVENDVGWIPHFMHRMDHSYEKGRPFERRPLAMPPSHYVRRQLFATFQDDPVGAELYRIHGEDNFMWASDFPHLDSTFPNSRRCIESNFATVNPAAQRKMVFGNAVHLYRMLLP